MHVQRLPEVQIQVMAVENTQGTWKSSQVSLLRPVERGILPLTMKFRPEKTKLVEMREQFRQQPSPYFGIPPDMQYTLETKVFQQLQDS